MSMQAGKKQSSEEAKTPFQSKSQIILDFLQRDTVKHAALSHADAEPEAEPVWPHQVEAALALQKYFKSTASNTALVVLPSGCGKTGVAVLASYVLCASRVLVITPDAIVSQQVRDHYKTFLLDRGIIKKEEEDDFLPSITMISRSTQLRDAGTLKSAHVVIANIHKVGGSSNVTVNEIDVDKYDLVIVDEAHRYPKGRWRSFADHFQESRKRRRCLFLTSTPHDNKKEPIFANIKSCYSLERQKAVEDGIIRDIQFDEVSPHTYDEKHLSDIYKLIADKMERYLDEHDNEERHARHQTKEVKHQGMVLAPNIIEADTFCGIYNKYHKDEKHYPDGKCKVFVFDAPKRVYQDFIDKKIRTLVVVRRLLEGFDHNFVSVLGVIRKVNPVSQVKFVHFLGRAVRKIDRKDPVKACIVTHQYFNLRRICEEFEQLAKEDPQGDIVTVYMLDDSLIKEAENIKNFLESDYIIQMCPHTLDQTVVRNISISAAYQHYAQCSRVYHPVSNMTDMVDIRPFSDLVKLMPQSFSEFSHSEEFEEELPAKLSQISEEYQAKMSVKLRQLFEENQRKLSKLQQLSEKKLSTLHQFSDEYRKEIFAKLGQFSEECQKEFCVKLCQLFEEYQMELKQLLEKELSAKPHQLSVQNQMKLSAKLRQLSEKCQKELYTKLDQLTKECQEKLSTKLQQLPEHYYKELSAKLPQLYEEYAEELQAELSRVTLKEESEPSSDFTTVQKVQIPDTSAAASSADVVVILGHSSVFSCGPFDTEELLVALTTKLKPTVIAFLSCCGGNNRYGPIYKMSHLLPQCLIGFYQRRVYVEELCKTSLVIGLRNYMYLQHKSKSANEATQEIEKYKRHTAIQAFACAKLSLESAHDPTVFVNDCNQNLIEIFIETTKDRDGRIPLSLLQLSMYYHMVVNSDMHPIDISMKSVVKKLVYQTTIKELDRNCISEIRKYRIQKLVPLVLELRLLKLYNKSLYFIKTGDPSSWKKVDNLQFLLAMLRGYWGKNTLTVIREWATFHLMEMMGEYDKLSDDKLESDAYLHKYKLCCVCYALLCEHHFVRFVEHGKDYHKFRILACAKSFGDAHTPAESSDDIYSITCDGYVRNAKVIGPYFLTTPQGPYPSKGELQNNWFHLFDNCEPEHGCANMWNRNIQWPIRNSHLNEGRNYKYDHLDFALAMVALNDSLQSGRVHTARTECYVTKDFINQDIQTEGYMQCFPADYVLHEMRVIVDYTTFLKSDYHIEDLSYRNYNHLMAQFTNNQIDRKLQFYHRAETQIRVSACRFVFRDFQIAGENNKTGVLYYTNNHYGHNLIDRDLLRYACYNCITRVNQQKELFRKQRMLCSHCKFTLMQRMIIDQRTREFPFKSLGNMTLFKSGNFLERIELQQTN